MRKRFPKDFPFLDENGKVYKCVADFGENGLAVTNESGELVIVSKSCVFLHKNYCIDLK